MLVEDELITALDIRRMLEQYGYDITDSIATGAEAVQRVKEINPDLIIMDIRLSDDIDGIEAARRIIQVTNVPIIFLTANTDPSTIMRANRTKHYGYLLKPIDHSQLNSIVSTALKRHQLEQESRL